jgi:tetratricopeptide (TPR) repeat protein
MDVAAAGGDGDEAWHAADYMVYAYLQLARDGEARKVIEETRYNPGATPRFIAPYAMAAIPARYVVERGLWKEAAQLQVNRSSYPFVDAITYFSRSLGAARSGDVASAKKDAEQLDAFHKSLVDAKNTYWATEVDVQRKAAAAWIQLAEGNKDEALKLMRTAADLEDRNEKHIVTPGRVVPARELLGEMLLQSNQPEAALKEFEASQAREPNRFRNYLGSAKAAELAGDKVKAAGYYRKLIELAKEADTDRPELANARRLASR